MRDRHDELRKLNGPIENRLDAYRAVVGEKVQQILPGVTPQLEINRPATNMDPAIIISVPSTASSCA